MLSSPENICTQSTDKE